MSEPISLSGPRDRDLIIMPLPHDVAPLVMPTLRPVHVPVAVVPAVWCEVMRAAEIAALDQMVAVEAMIVAILERWWWRCVVVAVVVPATGRKASKRDGRA